LTLNPRKNNTFAKIMINHLNGRLVEKSPTHVVIECGGVGYFLNISLNTFSKLPESESCKLFAHLVVREDSHTLYGFIDEKERLVYQKLISVSGIGPSTGRMILSTFSPEEVIAYIHQGDVAAIKSVKGIGAKTAQRLIIDLQDKIGRVDASELEKVTFGNNTFKNDALTALTSLGIDKNRADKIIDKILKSEGQDIKLEQLIKLALKQL